MQPRREEVHHAKEEGIVLELLTGPVRIPGEHGHTIAVECVRMEPGETDASGRHCSLPKQGSEFLVRADTVIMAVGTIANPLVSRSTRDLAIDDRGYIIADGNTGHTGRPGVYAAATSSPDPPRSSPRSEPAEKRLRRSMRISQ